jgi:hypothetical protein
MICDRHFNALIGATIGHVLAARSRERTDKQENKEFAYVREFTIVSAHPKSGLGASF